MRKKLIILSISLIISSIFCFSQENQSFLNEKIAEIVEANSSDKYIFIKDSIHLSVNNFFREYKTALNLTENDEMILKKSKEDNVGFTHYRFQQYYKGIKVEGGEFILHEKNGFLKFANGNLIKNLDINENPSITEEQAMQYAMNYTNCNVFAWQLDTSNYLYSEYPVAELAITKNQNEDNPNYELAYKIYITSIEPLYKNTVIYISSKNGEIIKEERTERTIDDCIDGEVNTLFNGMRDIKTRKVGALYYLIDECNDYRIQVKRFTSTRYYTVYDNNNTFVNTYYDRMSGTAFWAAKMASNYFYNTFGLKSFDGNGHEIILKVDRPYINGEDTSLFRDNTFWHRTEDVIYVCQKYNLPNHVVALDIIAHEFTHAVSQYSANFVKSGESDALNESFSDIFGTMVEYYTLGNNANYLIAEDVYAGGLRNMANPNSKNHPDTYQGDYWSIYNAPHTNSGIQNYWFYLLAEGGSGINDNGETYNVQGIGKNKAAQIAFYSLYNLLTSTSIYTDAKNCSIMAAMILFGDCSNEVVQTVNAWNAVGVSSESGVYYNKIVNSADMVAINLLNQLGFAVKVRALNNLESAQVHNYNTTETTKITYTAGNKITLKRGFKSGKYFQAVINECPSNAKSTTTDDDYTFVSETYNKEIITNNYSQVNIFPNPNNGSFMIDYQNEKSEFLKIAIYNTTGTLFYESDKKENSINFKNTISGIYYVIITLSDKIITKKIIVQ